MIEQVQEFKRDKKVVTSTKHWNDKWKCSKTFYKHIYLALVFQIYRIKYKLDIKIKKLFQNSRILFYVISYMRGISSSYVFPNNKAECVSYCIYTSYVQANRVQRVYMEFYFFFLRLLFSMSYFLKPASCCYCCFLR